MPEELYDMLRLIRYVENRRGELAGDTAAAADCDRLLAQLRRHFQWAVSGYRGQEAVREQWHLVAPQMIAETGA